MSFRGSIQKNLHSGSGINWTRHASIQNRNNASTEEPEKSGFGFWDHTVVKARALRLRSTEYNLLYSLFTLVDTDDAIAKETRP
jgi:hypothetical protein